MLKRSINILLALVVVGLLLAYSATFQVSEGYNAVVTQFGEPVKTVDKAGLYWKLPWPIQSVNYIDMRKRLFNTPMTETLTQDQTNVILLTYVVWRVSDPLLFLQSFRTLDTTDLAASAERKLVSTVAAAKTEHIGNYPLEALISTRPENIRTEQLEKDILGMVRENVKDFGVEVEQVGVKRIAYPKENMASALEHMRAKRRKLAERYRAEGAQQAKMTIDDANVAAARILKDGVEQAGTITADAEKSAAAIIGKAQTLDKNFYAFWRKLQLLKKTLGANSTVILRNDQGPFGVLSEQPGLDSTAPAPGRATP